MSQKPFSTLNVYLAAYPEMRGLPHTITRGFDGKMLFTFNETEDLRLVLADFANGAQVQVSRYIEHIKACKTSLYSMKRA